MTIPVIYSVAAAYPQDSFTILTQTFLMPVFINRPPNVNILGINTKASEKYIPGLFRFASALAKYDYDQVIDLQHIPRTMLIDALCRLKGIPVFSLKRDPKGRKQLIARKNKVLQPLRPMTDRYADVFREAGYSFEKTFTSLFHSRPVNREVIQSIAGEKAGKWIGIAPFARYREKIYPLDQMEDIVAALSKREDITLFLFGSRGKEEEIMAAWAERYSRVKCVAGRYALDTELMLFSQLDLLVSMDSANMQFASLVDIRVLSVWGATHPYAGFYGYRQQPEDAIQLDIPCRPCSIYGNKKCHRGDWACLTQLAPEIILDKIVNTVA